MKNFEEAKKDIYQAANCIAWFMIKIKPFLNTLEKDCEKGCDNEEEKNWKYYSTMFTLAKEYLESDVQSISSETIKENYETFQQLLDESEFNLDSLKELFM